MTRAGRAGLVLALVAAGAAGLWIGERRGRARAEVQEEAPARRLYHCPMHPTIIVDRPGDCPICQMRLVPMEVAPAGTPAPTPAEAPPAVGDRASVRIPPARQHLIGLTTVPVERLPFTRAIHAAGRVAFDETHMHHVHTKVPGWIEQFTVGAEGDPVRAGQPLLTIYSPDLLASQGEYLVALENRERLAAAGSPDVAADAEALVEAVRRRLLLWDMTEAQIAELARTGQAIRTVTLYAPISGTIVSRNVSHGERIESVTSLLDIADLSRVWVLAEIYEHDLPFLAAGQKATVTLSYLPGRPFAGRVDLVSPLVSETTRTVQVRIVLDNPDLALRPGMFADVALASDLGPRLSVPASAVLRTGRRDLAFVAGPDHTFEPRELRLGLTLPERIEILEGLQEGQRVVAAAGFFVDSESRLAAAVADAAEPAP